MAYRLERINKEIKRELSNLIQSELKDPRISEMVSITKVKTTNDFRYAKVFVSIYGDKNRQAENMKGLESASAFLRKELGKKIRLRYTPELIFEIDDSIDYGMHIDSILKDIKKSEKEDES
ncbi:30S ribosome-binding factor RbfA [Garciella nitratireducens]|uniref:Ribosome-binding factor A n=1 Tax=Garciella nitratireducens DSM 15102 TaxID=1121911 RepID=A0A1T4JWV7_9FIRM|nr:30S ribosome-binding factor RbfA [Garciella nitratireducens]RBP41170.1 ribosome-binding factor A [Garciella nitratireducens]SJZ34515.1 ribosome-binding factor A [Garciella nitratireducens DSM 15102]